MGIHVPSLRPGHDLVVCSTQLSYLTDITDKYKLDYYASTKCEDPLLGRVNNQSTTIEMVSRLYSHLTRSDNIHISIDSPGLDCCLLPALTYTLTSTSLVFHV